GERISLLVSIPLDNLYLFFPAWLRAGYSMRSCVSLQQSVRYESMLLSNRSMSLRTSLGGLLVEAVGIC
ncbi:MAG TPA: hypothetical protein VI704_07920, partial [Bacteroidota bacterium]|nr:hypothetical protein [Bacteroidota bacterium]